MNVKWLRRREQRVTHAFREAEVEQFATVVPFGLCGEFRVADLVDDPNAATCAVCQRAVTRIEQQQRRDALKTRAGGAVRSAGPVSSARTIRSAA